MKSSFYLVFETFKKMIQVYNFMAMRLEIDTEFVAL